jgi:hypothetical protein
MLAEKPLAQAENLQKTVYCLIQSGLAARRRPEAQRRPSGREVKQSSGEETHYHGICVWHTIIELGATARRPAPLSLIEKGLTAT